MSGKTKPSCGACKHRLHKQICGLTQSINFNQKIELSGSCEYFLKNPAYGYFTTGLASRADFPSELVNSILDLETAIRLGLSEDDEAHARSTLRLRYEVADRWEKTIRLEH